MAFKPPFEVGAVVSNAVMTEAFKVGNMGGMRRSKTTGTLVLISDNTKGLYSDKWNDGVLHYTGMGKIGDQAIDKTRIEHWRSQKATVLKFIFLKSIVLVSIHILVLWNWRENHIRRLSQMIMVIRGRSGCYLLKRKRL